MSDFTGNGTLVRNGIIYGGGGTTVLKSTLAVGATTLSFTDSAIGNDSLIRIYTNVDGVNPLTKTQSGTTVTLTFDAQSVAVGVAIEIRN